MSKITVHPAAALFPMMSDQELQELANDIKENGLREPIKLSADGKTLIDGRNREAACKLAKVEPTYERLNGEDEVGYVISANLVRRHMTAAQRAMAAAMIFPDGGKGGPGKMGPARAAFPMVPPTSLKYARMVLREAPDLADGVLNMTLTLEKAIEQAKERREDKSSRENKLDLLRKGARDLADRVADGLDVDEALAAMRERERKDREIVEHGKQAADIGISRFLADVASIAMALQIDATIIDKKRVADVMKAANQLQSLVK